MLEHGGNLHAATLRFGQPAEDWLDLSTGINPHGYPAAPPGNDAWHRLPEADPELARAACAFYGAPLMLSVAGTQAAIQALPRLRAQSRVIVAAPSYAEHAHQWAGHGHALRQMTYAELDDDRFDIATCDVLVVCNPNNPTGETIAPARLLAWADSLAARGGWLIVDEAFGDTGEGKDGNLSVAAHSDRPSLIVLRSVGKFFGLAGVRLGFVAAQPTLLQALADVLGPWSISGPAQQIGRAALQDRGWQSAMRLRLQRDGARLQALLAHHGIVANGCALFQWWAEEPPQAFWQHMAERGIWVRLFEQDARGIRLGLPPNEAGWQRLTKALEDWNKDKK